MSGRSEARGFRSGIVWAAVALVSVAGAGVPPGPALAETILARCTRDNTLFQDVDGDTANGAGPACFAGRNSQGNVRRTVCRFDLSEQIPAGSRVTRVELRLYVTQAPNTVPRRMSVHRVLADWGEGSSYAEGGLGDAAAPDDATWLFTFFPDGYWDRPGGDYREEESAWAEVPPVGWAAWSDNGLVEDVQAWVDDPDANFGWLVRGDESETATARRLASRESSRSSERPVLEVEFVPANSIRTSTWGREKARWRTPRPGS